MKMKPSLILFAIPALLLAACSGSSDVEEEEGSASGEVLEGTISDAMLPLATVTSAPPAMKIEPTDTASDAPADETSGETEEAEGQEAEAQPATEATATPAE